MSIIILIGLEGNFYFRCGFNKDKLLKCWRDSSFVLV
jgi:hypothetical protein